MPLFRQHLRAQCAVPPVLESLESLELKQQMPQLAFEMLEGIGISSVFRLEVLSVGGAEGPGGG